MKRRDGKLKGQRMAVGHTRCEGKAWEELEERIYSDDTFPIFFQDWFFWETESRA